MSGITQFNLSEEMVEMTRKSVDLYISKIYGDEPQFNKYIKANAAERAKMRSTKYLELPFFSTKFIRRFIYEYFEEQIRNVTYLGRSAERFNAKFKEVFGTENELDYVQPAIYNQIKRRIGEAGRICWYREFLGKLGIYVLDPRRSIDYNDNDDYEQTVNDNFRKYDNIKAVNDTFYSSKMKEDIEDFDYQKQMAYYAQYSYFRGAGLPIYDCYNDILEKRKVEWYTKEIYL